MGKRSVVVALVGVGAISLFASRGEAKDPAHPGAHPGKELYLRYCSACHGSEGKGDGVVAGLMSPHPTDLTQMAQKNAGQFPFYRTMRIIDGRDSLRAHGDPDMPVWGDIFATDVGASTDTQAIIRGKVMLITEYVESLQQKPK